MNIDITKPYQTRDGRKVRILCVDAKCYQPIVGLIMGDYVESVQSWCPNGSWNGSSVPHSYDLIPVPEHHVRWVNVYPNEQISILRKTKEEADKNADSNRIACVKVEWES